MKEIKFERTARCAGEYDVLVAGGGVAGIAAAVSARRMGKSVLLIEKTITLGGLATTGLINLFVPMCNGRGVKIIKGMAEEFLNLAIKYGYDTLPDAWKNGEPKPGEKARLCSRFSAPLFTLALNELVKNEGVDVLLDTVITEPVIEGSMCRGLIVENKSGCEFYGAKMIVDTTGDADVLFRAGVPTVQGGNYHTYLTNGVNVESCREAADKEDMSKLYSWRYKGGAASLYGDNQPEGKPLWNGTDAHEVTKYVVENQLECLDKIRDDDRKKRTIVTLPSMAQFRTTRHIDGDYTLKESDAYRHFDDSVAAICDFERRDYLFEIPYRTMIKSGFPNLITAGRCAAGEGYAWDVLRVIPPAILTGQAAGIACSMAIDDSGDICSVDISKLQKELESQNVMIHFDDSLVPECEADDLREDIGHI